MRGGSRVSGCAVWISLGAGDRAARRPRLPARSAGERAPGVLEAVAIDQSHENLKQGASAAGALRAACARYGWCASRRCAAISSPSARSCFRSRPPAGASIWSSPRTCSARSFASRARRLRSRPRRSSSARPRRCSHPTARSSSSSPACERSRAICIDCATAGFASGALHVVRRPACMKRPAPPLATERDWCHRRPRVGAAAARRGDRSANRATQRLVEVRLPGAREGGCPGADARRVAGRQRRTRPQGGAAASTLRRRALDRPRAAEARTRARRAGRWRRYDAAISSRSAASR